MIEILEHWNAERVWDKVKKLRLNSREALVLCGITPESYDSLTERNSPEMERLFLLATIKMFNYYSIPQMQLWYDKALELASMGQYRFNQNFEKVIQGVTPEKEINPDTTNLLEKINSSLRITELAEQEYKLKIKKNRTACPFHSGDNETSLSFDDSKNIFKCWSCGTKGNLWIFVKKMEELKENGNK